MTAPAPAAAVGVLVVPAPSTPLPINDTLTSGVLVGRGVIVTGWALANTSADTAAVVDVYDGLDDGGTLLASLTLPAGATAAAFMDAGGVACLVGLFVAVTAGAVRGAVWCRL